MSYVKQGPLQDPVHLTPFDLRGVGVEIVESVPSYFRFTYLGKGYALHDTPAQAIYHARIILRIWEDDAA